MKVTLTEYFNRELKYLLKKYPSLFKDLDNLVESLKVSPFQGTPLGKNCFKIRLQISSKNQGKSGGGRVITHIVIEDNEIFLLSIYDKSEKENISDAEILKRLKEIKNM